MKIVIHGYGTMGKIVHKLAHNKGFEIVGIIDEADDMQNKITYDDLLTIDYDILIDFSNYNLIDTLLNYLEKKPHKAIIATTNLSDEQLRKISELTKDVAIFQDYNTSYGVYVLDKMVQHMTKLLDEYDIEIVEKHHRYKEDSPSGTAKRIINSIHNVKDVNDVYDYSNLGRKQINDVGIHSLRNGNIVGEHEVFFGSDCDIISIKHEALSKELFAEGALKIASKIISKQNGLYNLNKIFEGEL